MSFLARISPIRAIADLRFFLSQRRPYELGFLALSIVVTTLLFAGFVHDSKVEKPYKRNIIYVEQWPASRTDAEIRAQQKIDSAAKAVADAELEKRQKKRQAEFKKIDDQLKALGI
ncbi:MAG: hypothetical protein B7Y45_07085 [Sphingomonas sp. 28-66-16]|nr:MAG: hypothetical protein B7Y45_07085 [Sphingomonas sp. 28-66-16]